MDLGGVYFVLANKLQNNVLLTGGEDSRLHAWSCPPLSSSSSADAEVAGFSPRKRDLDGDVEMGDSPESVSVHNFCALASVDECLCRVKRERVDNVGRRTMANTFHCIEFERCCS